MTIELTTNTLFTTQRFLNIKNPINVSLIGAGGTGSSVCSMLFKLNAVLKKLGGKGLKVTVYDPKKVSEANIGRQGYWSSNDVGHYKAQLMVSRYNQFGGVEWSYKTKKFDDTDKIRAIDLLITTVDSAKSRLEIGQIFADDRYISDVDCPKWLDLGNSDSHGQAVLGSLHNGDGVNTLPSVYQLFGQQWGAVDKSFIDTPSCSTEEAIAKQNFGVNDTLATNAISMIIFPLLRFGKINNHGFYFDLKTMTTTPMPICKQSWQIYGFK